MMIRLCLTALSLAAVAAAACAAPIQGPTTETIKDRASFIPQRKYQVLKDTAVGVLVSDVQAVMGHDGRGGPADAYGFSLSGGSYRWIYVPVAEQPLIRNLNVQVGADGAARKVYPSLSMANAQTVKQWNIESDYALVEVQVNDGLGSPAGESFVATSMRRLDGTRDFPGKLPEIVADAKKRHQLFQKEQQKAVEEAFVEMQKTALKDRKLTGPRETKELFYVTWQPETEKLRLSFRTTITDGAYQFNDGGDPRVPPFKGPPQADAPRAQPVPPRLPLRIRTGTTISVEYGVAYEVSKSGKVDRILILPPLASSVELPPAPLPGPRDSPPRPGIERD